MEDGHAVQSNVCMNKDRDDDDSSYDGGTHKWSADRQWESIHRIHIDATNEQLKKEDTPLSKLMKVLFIESMDLLSKVRPTKRPRKFLF